MPDRDEKTLQDVERVNRLKALIAGGQLGVDQVAMALKLLERNSLIGSPTPTSDNSGATGRNLDRVRYRCFRPFDRERADAILSAHGQSI